MLQDIRYGLRVLFKNPGFSLIAIVTLALGIGANAAIFSVVYGVLLKPLPYQNGNRLVVLHQQASRANLDDVPFAAKDIFDYRDKSRTLDGVVEHHSMNFLLIGPDSAERVNTAVVSANFFDVLGVKPLLGRSFVAKDEEHGADAVLMFSYEYWKNRYGGDSSVVGRVLQMNNRPHTVIGVLPPIPQYPVTNDVYMPTSGCPYRSSAGFINDRNARMMTAFGRLKTGISLEQAQADLTALAHNIEEANPEIYPKKLGYTMAVAPLQQELTKRARTTFLILLGAAGFVLLIACANVANLLLARLLKLDRELAIRNALGASKSRLVRQLLTESMILSLTGGALGLAIAPATLSLLVKFAGRFTARASEVSIDAPVLLFTLAISILTGVVFGIVPAFSSSKSAGEALKQASSRTTVSRGRQQLRGALVVAQVAISFMLLIGAGLMIRSFVKLQSVQPGFNPERLLTMRLSPNGSKYSQAQLTILGKTVLDRIRNVSGVQSAAMASTVPLNPASIAAGPGSSFFTIEGRPVGKGELAPQVDIIDVSEGYFETIRQPIVAGRSFTEHDDAKAPPVAVINQAMAKHRWPTEDPIGKRVSIDGGQHSDGVQHWMQIIGIAGDVRAYGLDHNVSDQIYVAQSQAGFTGRLVVRTSGDPMNMYNAVRRALHDIDTQIAVDRVSTLSTMERDSVESPRVTAILLGLFAGLAVLISACGIAAVMALSVTQRSNELGIRMALGASRESIIGMVMGQGLALVIAGTAIGLAGAIALTRLLSTLLYATSPTDVLTFAAVSALFVTVGALACFVPARQVTSIDPLNALRQE
jgi:putative ABC transport system permease protein